jgi:hypothetical protein
MALLLSDILNKFLAYVPSRPGGGSRDELVNLAEALGMDHTQIEEALTAFLTTGVEIGSFDEPTYTSFADRYVELGERGPSMAEMVAREAATRKLEAYDLNLTIAVRQEQLVTIPAEMVGAVDAALAEARAARLSPPTQALIERWAVGARSIAASGAIALESEITRLLEQRNRIG